jgi:transposase
MLGVDVSKATLYGTRRDPATEQIDWQGEVPNTAAGIRQLLRRVPSGSVVVEPTGRYGEGLIRAIRATGREALLATPRKARDFLRSVQPRAKTDRVDSAGRALYGLRERLRPYPLPSPAVEQVKQLLAARRGLSRSLTSLKLQRAALPLAAEALTPAIDALAEQLAAVDRRLADATEAAPELASVVAALATIPGIGPVTGAALAACLVDKRFTHPDQFVAYVGLDVRAHQSGRRTGRARLSKQGDAELRRLLYLAASASTRAKHDRTFAHRYARERAKGLATTAALNAVARKLAKVAWSVAAHGTLYDPTRVDTQP